jgi:hypothetical protein
MFFIEFQLLKYELARFTSGRFVEEQADQGEVQESGGS